jgi:hypothetical protein
MKTITLPENIGARKHLRLAAFTRFDDVDYTRVSAGLAEALQDALHDPVAAICRFDGLARGGVIDVLVRLSERDP